MRLAAALYFGRASAAAAAAIVVVVAAVVAADAFAHKTRTHVPKPHVSNTASATTATGAAFAPRGSTPPRRVRPTTAVRASESVGADIDPIVAAYQKKSSYAYGAKSYATDAKATFSAVTQPFDVSLPVPDLPPSSASASASASDVSAVASALPPSPPPPLSSPPTLESAAPTVLPPLPIADTASSEAASASASALATDAAATATAASASTPTPPDSTVAVDAAAAAASDAAERATRAAADIASQLQSGYAAAAARASAAAKAASEARAASAAASAKAAAAAAAAASATSTTAGNGGEKVPTLAQYLRIAPVPDNVLLSAASYSSSSSSSTGGVRSLSEIREKLGLLGANIVGEENFKAMENSVTNVGKSILASVQTTSSSFSNTGGIGESATTGAANDLADSIKGAVAGASAGAAAAAAGMSTPPFEMSNLRDLVANLKLEEYAGWYATAAALIFAAYQRQVGRDESKQTYQEELALAKARADEAAAAAAVAAKGAALAKNMAAQVEKETKQKQRTGTELLESAKMKEMQVERDLMREDLRKVTSETIKLRAMLNELLTERAKSGETVFVEPATDSFAETFSNSDQIPVTYMTLERDPDEDARILAAIKELDMENQEELVSSTSATETAKMTTTTTTKKKSSAKRAASTKSTKKNKDAMSAEAAAAALDEASKLPPAKTTTKKTAKSTKKAASSKKKKAAPKKEVVVAKEEEKVPKKTEKTEKTEVELIDNPWAALSDSTLQRKTVAELTEYLADRGNTVIDESGKVPKKADLVSAVRSL